MNCPLCEVPGLESQRPGYTLCAGCGSWLSDRTKVYDETYWAAHGGLDAHRSLVTSDRLQWWLDHIPTRSRILEVGCAPGALLDALVARGDDAFGVDPTMPASKRVASVEYPWPSLSGLWWSGHFEAVVMLDVLEHMPDPALALACARCNLVSGGRLYLQLPTLRGQEMEDRFWCAGEHTWIPTQAALNAVLERAGFRVESDIESWHAGHEWTVASRS